MGEGSNKKRQMNLIRIDRGLETKIKDNARMLRGENDLFYEFEGAFESHKTTTY